MHQSDAIDDVQHDALTGAGVLCRNRFVVAGVGVDDAATARRHPFKTAFVERLQMDKNSSGSCNILGFNQLLAAAELASGDVVLNHGDDHRDDHPWPGDAGRLRHHPLLHDLSLDLAEARLQYPLASPLRNENPGGPHEWIDDIARAQRELLDPAGNPGFFFNDTATTEIYTLSLLDARLFRRQ